LERLRAVRSESLAVEAATLRRMLQNHGYDMDIDALRDEWDSLVRADPALGPAACDELHTWQIENGASFDGRSLCKVLRPAFISPSGLAEVRRICVHATGAIRAVRAWLLSGAWSGVGELSEEALRLVRIDPGFDRLGITTRLDAFATPKAFSFIELNAEAPAGIAYHDVLSRMFEGFGAMQKLAENLQFRPLRVTGWLLQALLTTWNEWGRGAGKPRIAIVDWRDSPTIAEFRLLADSFKRSGYSTVVVDPRDLEFRGGRLYGHGGRIDLVYRRVLFEDCLARPDDVAALVDSVSARAVCMVNPFRAHLLHRKRLFAYLTDPTTPVRFSDEQREVLRAHVPWTRVLCDSNTTSPAGKEVDLLPFVRQNRSEFVIKPDDDYGGHGVCLGWSVDQTTWEQTIERSARIPHVVQKRVPVHSLAFPRMDGSGEAQTFLVDRDPYVFRGVLGGFLTRLSAGELANVTAGGGMVPTFLVSPRA
jgi:hypothetical protein